MSEDLYRLDMSNAQQQNLYNQSIASALSNPSVLREAEALINGDRQKDHDDADKSFREISRKDVAMMMVLMKVARHTTGEAKRDNLVDICGYAALAERF